VSVLESCAAISRVSWGWLLIPSAPLCCHDCICRVGQNHIYIHGVCTVFLAGKIHNTRSFTAYIYGPGQPYAFGLLKGWWEVAVSFCAVFLCCVLLCCVLVLCPFVLCSCAVSFCAVFLCCVLVLCSCAVSFCAVFLCCVLVLCSCAVSFCAVFRGVLCVHSVVHVLLLDVVHQRTAWAILCRGGVQYH
jgi:hypothetical protein